MLRAAIVCSLFGFSTIDLSYPWQWHSQHSLIHLLSLGYLRIYKALSFSFPMIEDDHWLRFFDAVKSYHAHSHANIQFFSEFVIQRISLKIIYGFQSTQLAGFDHLSCFCSSRLVPSFLSASHAVSDSPQQVIILVLSFSPFYFWWVLTIQPWSLPSLAWMTHHQRFLCLTVMLIWRLRQQFACYM